MAILLHRDLRHFAPNLRAVVVVHKEIIYFAYGAAVGEKNFLHKSPLLGEISGF
jgi:hypothetical protein